MEGAGEQLLMQEVIRQSMGVSVCHYGLDVVK